MTNDWREVPRERHHLASLGWPSFPSALCIIHLLDVRNLTADDWSDSCRFQDEDNDPPSALHFVGRPPSKKRRHPPAET